MELIEEEIKQSFLNLFGLDEVGRGPLAGPVVSCCCAFIGAKRVLSSVIKERESLGINDSKKLSEKKRKSILAELGVDVSNLCFGKVYEVDLERGENGKLFFCLAKVDHDEIDKINILQASLKSMDMAYSKVSKKKDANRDMFVWVDGNKLPQKIGKLPQAKAIVKGDSKSFVIALASIIAKEKRDQLMKDFSVAYPGYGFEKHAGYPTRAHKEAVKKHGPSPIHRLSFKGVL